MIRGPIDFVFNFILVSFIFIPINLVQVIPFQSNYWLILVQINPAINFRFSIAIPNIQVLIPIF